MLFCIALLEMYTKTTDFWAAMASKSAQETVLGHAFSTAAFILSITSKPRAEFAFPNASFSVLNDVVLSNNIDASHPCPKQLFLSHLVNWTRYRYHYKRIQQLLKKNPVTVPFILI